MFAPDAAQRWNGSLCPTVTAADSTLVGRTAKMPELFIPKTTLNHIPDAAEGWENSTLLLCRLMLTKKTSYVIRYRDDAIQFR